MNAIHAHLVLNHFPSIGLVIGLLFWIIAIILRDNRIQKLVAGLIIVISALTVLTYITGENAEDSVEKIPEISKAFIEAHEESAKRANMVMLFFGLISLVFLWNSSRSNYNHRKLILLMTLFFLVEIGLIFHTAYLGGMIRHPEAYESQKVIQEFQIDHDDD